MPPPDNIAPPIAACLGDLVTLCLFGAVSAALINLVNTPVPFVLILLVLLSSAFCTLVTYRNPFVKDLITQGWSPLFGAMVISSGTGIVLDIFSSRYEGFPILAIVISGLVFSF
jgi:solute carrier family 41